MNVNPLTSDQRSFAIARLGEGLTPRAIDLMHWTLSDGHVRSCYEGVFGEPVPEPEELRTSNIQPRTLNLEQKAAA